MDNFITKRLDIKYFYCLGAGLLYCYLFTDHK